MNAFVSSKRVYNATNKQYQQGERDTGPEETQEIKRDRLLDYVLLTYVERTVCVRPSVRLRELTN